MNKVFQSAFRLGIIAVLGTLILVLVYQLTRDRIEDQERRAVLALLNQVLDAGEYDNALHEDLLLIEQVPGLNHSGPVRVYRARSQSRPVAVIFDLTTPEGYNGDIRLLIGVLEHGVLSGVRVVTHRETPGLGDPIEIARSNWVLGFDGKSLQNPDGDGWAVKRDGGEFDQFTGATITPRAVVEAVQDVLTYFEQDSEALFENSSGLNK